MITISPVSRRDYKIWPAEKFAAICDFLIEKYKAQILFLWGPGEIHFIESVRQHMNNQDLGDYAIPTLRETVSLLKFSDFHFGNDNGPMHFANAAGTPSLAVFGRPLMENWIDLSNQKNRGIEFDPGCKHQCTYPDCQLACINDLEVEDVKQELHKSLEFLKL